MDTEDWRALRFEAGQIFTPSTPIGLAETFAGRAPQINKLLDVIGERGRHAIIYGEPGVGKTSIAQVLRHVIPVKTSTVRYIRKPTFSTDTYSSIWQYIFREMEFSADIGEGQRIYSVADLYANGVNANDVVRELSRFSENDIPIIVIDEYNLVKNPTISRQMAETVKAVSDAGLKATIIIVGVSDNVSELVSGHESILRCSEEVLMPRMESDELRDVLEGRVRKLGMTIDGDARWKVVNLSKGLPSFAHSLGRGAVQSAIDGKRLQVKEADVDRAIDDVVNSSQNTLKTEYDVAIRSNQEKARYRQILTACALAKSDEIGYFTPKQVQGPLSAILRKQTGIDGFNDNLKDFTEERRGKVLQQQGVARIYRYRFRNPAMQPYVIMKGIKEGYLDEEAKLALSHPEQDDLFASGY